MTHRLATNYAKNYCNQTPIVKVIVENVVTFFWGGTQCRSESHGCCQSIKLTNIVGLAQQ